MKPTVVLVHGAYAESSSWNGVLEPLTTAGHRVIAFATPLRGVASDAALLSDLIRTLDGPVVLVGHSYGGAVLTNTSDAAAGRVIAAVYVAGFALDAGESCADASALAPGSTLAETLVPVPLAAGGSDTYIAPEKYHHQFAADLPVEQARWMAVTQRPVTDLALAEPSGERPLWQSVPSWFLFGELDHNIPAGAHRIMAARAKARDTVEISGASHVVGISHPAETARIILEAAAGDA
ncbi:alpha/beta fold hydrolase [Actinoplanes solisilvae]|uniref:alpha/beta fold hydrolase n=1 Tax=Actinoplanes solisilvae TaxID=2486853 RepID=UPI000FDAACA3|nr:alpha/beta hydrolase [Actinoplanes solisilvae]